MRVAVGAAALALSACSAAPPPEASQAGEAFDPVAFFTGASHGEARIDQIFRGTRRMSVDSVGRSGKGGLLLEQRVTIDGEPTRKRRWHLRRIGQGRYAGALTDANGPVETRQVGRAIRIRYPMKGGLQVEQWLVALPGGRSLDNRMTVTKWGMRVATLRERIEKR